MDRKYDVITLGEILLRLSTPINGRLAQGDTLMKHLGGAELNIASEIGQLGLKTAMISKIPNNLHLHLSTIQRFRHQQAYISRHCSTD